MDIVRNGLCAGGKKTRNRVKYLYKILSRKGYRF